MKNLLFIAMVACLFAACKNNSAPNNTSSETSAATTSPTSETPISASPNGRFDDKSGILITETDMMGMGKTTAKLIFDDYGKHTFTEMKMNMMGKEMTTKSLIKDGYAYTWTEPVSMAMKAKIDESKPDDKNIDYKHLSEEMKKKLNMKEEADETVDGKNCKVYSFSFQEGMTGKYFVWKGMPIQSEMNMSGKKIVTKFVSYEADASVPSSTFEVPSGIEFKEMNISKPKTGK